MSKFDDYKEYDYKKIIKKDDIYYNNDYIIDNNDNFIYEKYNKYYKATNFSDLFSIISRSNTRKTPSQQRTQSSNTQQQAVFPKDTTQVVVPDFSQTDFQGKAYDANQMWSPASIKGKVYEWDRGVLGISYNGEVEKESLDGTINHHADATVRIVRALGGINSDSDMPFQAAVDGTKEGIIIFQSEGDNAFVYFPENITSEQYQELVSVITPRSGFNFSFVHGEEIFEEQNARGVLTYANNIKAMPLSTRR